MLHSDEVLQSTVILIVKSVPYLSIVAVLVVSLAGCGQKGPLYMPAKPTPVATPAPQPAPANSATPASK
ncbi:MAG: LPS translocon maturation chaperone LptM [Noviherbaspirillum sp.]